MITQSTTINIFDTHTEAIINTVNTKGICGKGLALEFKKKYPINYRLYKEYCEKQLAKPGHLFITNTGLFHPKYIVNFFTKEDWKYPSKIEWIESGLLDLRTWIIQHKIKSIAIPLLGCANGKLSKDVVIPMIETALSDLDCEIIICNYINN